MKVPGDLLRASTLAAFLTAGAIAAAGGEAKAAPGGPEQLAPLDAANLMALYLDANPKLRTDPPFARDWTAVTKCGAWTRLATDEFRAAPFLKAGAAELAGMHDAAPQAYGLRLDRSLGRYDATKQEFALHTVGVDDVLPVRVKGFNGGGSSANSFQYGCEPSSGQYPVEFDVRFDNPQVADGLPMAPDEAASFAQARTYPNGSRDNGVAVALKLRLSVGTPRPASGGVKGVLVPVMAHIEDVLVQDTSPQRKPIYHLDDGKRQAGEAAAAQARERARAEASVKQLDGPALAAQFEMERLGPKVGTDPYRIGLSVAWSKPVAPGSAPYVLALKPTDTFSLGYGVGLRFENAAEASALVPTPELKFALDAHGGQDVSVVYVPVGASDDDLKGGRVVVGHVLSVDMVDRATVDRKLYSVRTVSAPSPWKQEVDGRLAAAFDVLGIKTGMAPGEVSSIAASELGQTLAFDEAKGEVRSSAADCDFEVRRGRQPPPLGRRCLVASFLRTGAAGPWTLARVRLTQSVGADRQKATLEAMLAKYGKPDLSGPFDGPRSLADLEGTDPPRIVAVGWGARLSNVRPEPDGISFPLHALEATTKTIGDETFVGLTVTDWAAMNAANEAKAAAAKRASEAVVPKF